MKFLGRQRELKFMHSELDKIRRGGRQPGRCLLLRGRRRVGKTRLAEEFCQQAQVLYFFYAASGVSPSAELDRFSARILASDLPNRHVFDGMISQDCLIVSAELSLAAEFPVDAHARSVLSAIGAGERTFSLIQRNAGELAQATFSRALQLLSEKRLIVAEHPISLQSSKQTRYRVTDPYLRFWLTFIGPFNEEINRGRADIVLSRISKNWTSWRGRVIEPIIRDALARLLPNDQTPWLDPAAVQKIGSYWTRTNDVEIDLVAADRAPIAKRIGFVGTIKWHEHSKFDRGDVAALIAHRERFPDGDEKTPLIAVSRVAGEVNGVDAHFTAADLINAWPAG